MRTRGFGGGRGGSAGALKQRAYTKTELATSGTSTIPYDNTLPQSGEGTEVLSQAITPQSTANIISARAVLQATAPAGDVMIAALFRDTVCVNAAIFAPDPQGVGYPGFVTGSIVIEYAETATGTSAQTWSVRVGTLGGGAWALNTGATPGGSTQAIFGNGVPVSMLTIEESAP
jgi:hypothetical protein